LGDDIFDPEDKQRSETADVESVPESDDHVFAENEAENEQFSSDFEQSNKPQTRGKILSEYVSRPAHAYVAHSEPEYQAIAAVANHPESAVISNKLAHTRLSYSQNDSDWIGNGKETPRSSGHVSNVSSNTPRHVQYSQTPVLR
jgi:hypothetical protein